MNAGLTARSEGPPRTPKYDDIARSLHQLADEYERHLASTASVEREHSYGHGVRLHPARRGARSVGWVDLGDELAAFVGEHGWWELERQPDDVDFVKLVCDAVIAGRGYEVTAPARSLVALQLADGQPARDVTSEGCLLQFLPLPGWKRWGRRVTYLPYH